MERGGFVGRESEGCVCQLRAHPSALDLKKASTHGAREQGVRGSAQAASYKNAPLRFD